MATKTTQNDPECERFCDRIDRVRNHSTAVGVAIIGCIANLLFLAFASRVVSRPEVRDVLVPFHGGCIAVYAVLLVAVWRKWSWLSSVLCCLHILYVLLYAWVLFTAQDAELEVRFRSWSAFGVVTNFGILAAGNHKRWLAAMILTSFVSYFPSWGVIGPVYDFALYFTESISVAALLWLFVTQRAVSRREYAFRTMIAPAHIVREAGADLSAFDLMLKANQRSCVCISSDWRGYQALSGAMPAEALASALSSYYDVCEGLLKEALPSGNYYCDWIADELFVVCFAIDGEEDRLVSQALRFCTELIRAKTHFFVKLGVPRAIDIGLSKGEAVVGMMGPKGFRKATALGEVPGRSRRVQTIGKVLRELAGERDRVIFGTDVMMQIREPYAVQKVRLDQERLPKDLKDGDVYFIDPTGTVVVKEAA